MGLTLDQLLSPPDKPTLLTAMLRALQGVGYTQRPVGYAPGQVYATGVPTAEVTLVVWVTTAGQVGSAQVRISTDGGVSFGPAITIPSSGQITVVGTGVTLVFSNGPEGVTESFHLDNTFAIELEETNFAPTSWQPGSTPLTLVEVDAQVLEDVYALIKAIAAGGLRDYALDDWLDLLGENLYDLERLQGSVTRGTLLLSCASGAGPVTRAAGTLWALSNSGLLYSNEADVTIPDGGSVSATFKAEQVGQKYNVANNTIQALATPIAGVTVNNPNPGSGTWVVTQGADKESDPLYGSRMSARWPSLSDTPSTAEVYDFWSRTASTEVTRTNVIPSGTVPGEVDVYLAGPSGPVSSGAVSDVDAYIQPRVLLTNTALVQNATAHPVTITADIYVKAGFETSAAIACAANLDALISALPVGGTLYLSNIIEQLSLPTGVRNVTVSGPVADVVLGATEVATLTQALTFHTV